MLSKGFKIVAPKTFEIDVESIESNSKQAIVRIDNAAICKADLRYYLGNRDEKILGMKYPMRLIHEAVGTVVKDNTGKFKAGDKVILIPNICMCEKCDFEYLEDTGLGENYCPKVKFASSNYDGFSAECISYLTSNLIPYSSDINSEIAVFTELISVAVSAIRRIGSLDNKVIGIWGDGVLGYILSHVIKMSSENSRVVSIGRNAEKLEMFNVDSTYLVNDKELKHVKFDLLFECVGGIASENAINQMIECARFGADIVLTGVTEEGVRLNTRRILEKAVRITGSTRSTINDFKEATEMLRSMFLQDAINKLILSINEVKDISGYYKVFELESRSRKLGKHIIKMNL